VRLTKNDELSMKINSGYLYAIFSAVLFGASTPAAKYFLKEIHPILLAGLFYSGAGIGIFIILLGRKLFLHGGSDTKLHLRDFKWLLIATLCGGIAAPVLLMVSLAKMSASTVALLLNLETVFTALTAWFLFKEHTSRNIVIGLILIVVGGFILAWPQHFSFNVLSGVIFITLACFLWAIDNNVTRNISNVDPLIIVAIKSLVSGATNTTLAFILGIEFFHRAMLFGLSATVGFFSYGLSLVCFVLALRYIGTGRTSACFSLAPFIGASFAVIFLNDPLTIQLILAGSLMGLGTWLHLTEHHEHEHFHDRMIHEHRHIHDDHHQHNHHPDDPVGEPHSHAHEHEPLKHSHQHFPDIHHRHKH